MSKYGVPYQGSKAQIADDIINELPRGNRFVDLFGGGFAMSHCALLSGKYKYVYYNDYNPLIVDLVKNSLQGKYKEKPEFVAREEFLKNKDKDSYIKYIWSFGNNGNGYLFGKDKEVFKKQGHELVVNKNLKALSFWEDYYKDSCNQFLPYILTGNTWQQRRLLFVNIILKIEAIRVAETYYKGFKNIFKDMTSFEFYKMSNKYIVNKINELIPSIPKKNYKGSAKNNLIELKQLQQLQRLQHLQQLQHLEQLERLQQLEQLQRLQQLERLEQLEQLERLEINNISYLDYVYKDGDIVYLDPPYENTAKYSNEEFNHKEFYNWVYSRPYQVFFSSYEITDDRFYVVWSKQKRSLFSQKNTDGRIEYLYSNKRIDEHKKQGQLFAC